MTYSVAASHAKGKSAIDKIFGANAAAVKAIAQYGNDKVINATIGAFLNDDEKLACLPTVEKAFRALPTTEIINYAPIAGLPDYLDAAIDLTFADNKPEAYIKAVATAGGSGAIHHVIANYTEIGDTVLTSDWFWSPYKVLCVDALRKLDTYTLFDGQQRFNIQSFAAKVNTLLVKQNNLVIIINAPAHNPTGYSLTDGEWENVLAVLRESAKDENKNIILLADIAYLDFAGEKNASRTFMKKFGGLPKNILPVLAFSMSKGYTMYGQRTGAMIGISSNQDVINEFADINQYTSRATWSNINRACMRMLANIYQDKTVLAQVEKERIGYYALIRERADIFMQEAAACKLHMLPYIAGFFLTIPTQDSDNVCEKLKEDNVFAVSLAKGVRIAVCAVPSYKIKGLAGKVAKAMTK